MISKNELRTAELRTEKAWHVLLRSAKIKRSGFLHPVVIH
ncbi:Uncharacterized protein dnm_065810 [Desulfonema magnum]|uniref:Uncharacterized protein n=1 Tax=Desulfonema magnum TaxID=45655 RepID=A0A975BSZ9_9BACT|nr:Uncharacterized protein dnm_065810 [Desulfonema magnum]